MNFAFRTDASTQIGSGHVMRCLALADFLRDRGAQCHFICRDHAGNLVDVIRRHRHEVRVLERGPASGLSRLSGGLYTAYEAWLGVTSEADAEQTSAILRELKPDWLCVDHYALDAHWETIVAAHCNKLMVIDDLANRSHICRLLIDHNLGRVAADYRGLVGEDCTVLVGPSFGLLRPEFGRLHQASLARKMSDSIEHVLIAMGGADKDNITGSVLNALARSRLPNSARITVILGDHAPWRQEVETMAESMSWSTSVICGVNNMAELMVSADISIGAAGISAWERCCLGLPTIIVPIAENQRLGASALAKFGAAICLEIGESITVSLPNAINCTLDVERRTAMSQAALAICDGSGCERVMPWIFPVEPGEFRVRRAVVEDELQLFEWANDTLTRSNSFSTEPIRSSVHRRWFIDRIQNEVACRIYIVEAEDGAAVGQVRFERSTALQWETDYSLAPAYRGRRLGMKLLHAGMKALLSEHPAAEITGKVKNGNIPSCRVFESLGFVPSGDETGSCVEYRYTGRGVWQ